MKLKVTLYTTVSNFTSAPTSKDVYYITSEQLEQDPFDIRKCLPSEYHPYIRKIVATLSADRQRIEISSEKYGNHTLEIGKDEYYTTGRIGLSYAYCTIYIQPINE